MVQNDTLMTVRVRIAPSPTGDPHVGTAYIALFNYLFAKKMNGTFLLRIEDTDQARSRPEYEASIFEALAWCGLTWEEGPDKGGPFGPYRQSERTELYQKHAYELVEKGFAYKCFATAQELSEMREIAAKQGKKMGYDRRYRNLSPQEIQEKETANLPFVIRLKMPLTGECVYEDEVKGRTVVPWADVDDQILLKSDGFPTYHLANVVDDHLMQISHVIRGDEWMSSTPKHLYLYEAFGWTPPKFLHMPLLLGKDGKKLSKRKNPTSVFYFKEAGYLPEALTNFLSLMGYSMPDDQELYTLDEISERFDPKRIGTSGAFFDIQKLDWINQKKLIETIPEEGLLTRLKEWKLSDAFLQKLMPLAHTRIKTFGEFFELCDFFFINHLPYTKELLCPKNTSEEITLQVLQNMLFGLDEAQDWSGSSFERISREVAELHQLHYKKTVIHILFASLMGKTKGPPLFASVDLLGKEITRVRLIQAIEALGGISNKKLTEWKKTWDKRTSQGS